MRTRHLLVACIAVALSLLAAPAFADAHNEDKITLQSFNDNTGEWHGIDSDGTAVSFYFGNPSDVPLIGDWDGDGTETPGLYRQSTGFFYGTNASMTGIAQVSFYVGDPGDVPLVGDFDGDGFDTVSVYRPSEGKAFIMNEMGQNGGAIATPEWSYYFGDPGDKPFVGDFDGNGTDTLGLHREGSGKVYFTNSHATGSADYDFFFGNPGDVLLAGDWNRDGMDTVAVYRPANGVLYMSGGNATAGAAMTLYVGDVMPTGDGFAINMPDDIVDTAIGAGSFNTLVAAVQAAGLEDTLRSEGPFTVLAPTDDAFAALGTDTINALIADPDTLSDILLYHVISGAVTSDVVVTLDSATMANGDDITIAVVDGQVVINDSATVTAVDIMASNGVIHVLDAVLLPPADPEPQPKDIVDTAIGAGTFNTLVAAVQAAGLEDTLRSEGPFTVLAPTDDAFAALGTDTINALIADPDTLSDILLYHVISGAVTSDVVVTLDSATMANGDDITIAVVDGQVVINDSATVTAVDIMASNGVIHVLDAVLLPPADPEPQPKDIVDTAIGAGSFNTLVAAVQAAGLEDTLRSEGPFTVLAPTDDAFAALGTDTINALIADPDTLSDILLYHVISGAVTSDVVVTLDSATMANGDDITIAVVDGQVVINDSATVTAVDIMASNGVIHVLDAVLLPPADPEPQPKDIVDTAIGAGTFNTLVAAVQAAGLEDTLRSEGPFTVLAPTDDAFAALGTDTINALIADPDTLSDILLYHVISGAVTSDVVVTLDSATMANGDDITIAVVDGQVVINDSATVTAVDIMASNGVIHVLDAVLLPPADPEPQPKDIVDTAIGAGTFNTLVAAVQAAGLEDTLRSEGPFTVLAPTDDAFAALGQSELNRLLANPHELAEILKYHVIAGKATSDVVVDNYYFKTVQGHPVFVVQRKDALLINDANVIATDIMASNGVIHVIDKVLYPKPVRSHDDIVDTAIEAELATLVAAVQAAHLEDVLRSDGPFTVFAPTEAAFAELGEDTLRSLLANPEALADILLYHVASGETTSKELGKLDSVEMANGDRIHVDFEHGYQYVNGARILAADTLVSNGIIHIIDKVLIP